MNTDGVPKWAVLAVVIVRQSLIKLSGGRWIRVKEKDWGRFMKYLKARRSNHHVAAQNTAADQWREARNRFMFLQKNGFQRCVNEDNGETMRISTLE